jgi:hypothetical protein
VKVKVKDAQRRSNVSNQISNNSPTQSKDHGVAGAFVQQKKVFDRRLSLAAFGGLAWGDRVC